MAEVNAEPCLEVAMVFPRDNAIEIISKIGLAFDSCDHISTEWKEGNWKW
jgi:hypothetical protein